MAMSRTARVVAALVAVVSVVALPACTGRSGRSNAGDLDIGILDSIDQRGAYVAAYEFGRNLREQGIAVEESVLMQGMRDGFGAARPRMTEAEMHRVMLEFRAELERRERARSVERAQRNRDEGEAFLEANRSRTGVVELPSGLQYEILRPGSGAPPVSGGRVTVHYEGRLVDGTVFNTSYGMGRPATFAIDEVIPGWREALMLMRPGSRWRIVLPPALAFGTDSPSPQIGPGATVIFDIELLAVE